MKAITFARVSSKEQEAEGYSLPSQEKLFKTYADDKGFSITRKFSISESASGKKQRKVFNEMLDYVKKKNIMIIICEKVDRLTRNFRDAVAINDWLEENYERQAHLVKDSLILHKNSRSQEKLNWNIRIVFAQNYIDNLSEEVKKGQKEKLAQGWLPLRAPLGYKTAGERRRLIHVIDETKAPLIIKMYELYSTGNYSLTAITKIMKKEGLRGEKGQPVCKSTVHRLLSNHFYYGKNEWNGVLTDGKQEPLITKELFDLVQEKLSHKFGGKPRYRKHLPVFRAKVKCEECGGIISWELQKKRWYGHCNHYRDCSQKAWIKQTEVEAQIFPIFDEIAPMGRNILKVLEDTLKDSHFDEINYNTNKREEFSKIIRIADKRIEGAYKDKLDGRMPPLLCEKLIKESTDEKEEAINSLAKLSESRYAYYQAGISIHELALNAKKIYESEKATTEEKRLLLSDIFSNLFLNEGNIEPKYTPAAEFLAEWMPKLKSNFELVEISNSRGEKEKTGDFSSVCPVVRGRGDLNP